jgi:hypothetical protein
MKAVRQHLALVLGALVLAGAAAEPLPAAAAKAPAPSSIALEKELQRLEWEQFRTVVSAIPKLKADVDAYGPLGWRYVQQRYRTHAWRKSLDKLDEARKRELAELIRAVKAGARKPGTRPTARDRKS